MSLSPKLLDNSRNRAHSNSCNLFRHLTHRKMLTLYLDKGSQPCRSVMAFCYINDIPFEEVIVSVAGMQHKDPDFLAINPYG
jgi:hypothetical protein